METIRTKKTDTNRHNHTGSRTVNNQFNRHDQDVVDITALTEAFRNKKVLVIGDFITDIYLKGTSTRLSPEAPVPVVDITERKVCPGGAANVACNLHSLGARVSFCTVMGMDENGSNAMRHLRRVGIDTQLTIRHSGRKTITKTRIVSGGQVITRIDEGTIDRIDEETTSRLLRSIETHLPGFDAIIFSDYDKGIITEGMVGWFAVKQKARTRFLAVDSKRLRFFRSLNASFIKPNYEEAVHLMGCPQRFNDRIRQVIDHAGALHKMTRSKTIGVTLDSEGSVIIESGRVVHVCPAPRVAKPQVAGAGDTWLAAFVLARLCCENNKICASIATTAAHIAIQKESTATCDLSELTSVFAGAGKRIVSETVLKDLCETWRRQGRRIVFTNGCFDILHSGHVSYLEKARQLGDVLLVGLNTDESIRRIKGEGRPVNTLNDRMQVLSALSSIDHIIAFGDEKDDTPVRLIRIVRPDFFVKGGDYIKTRLPEASEIEKNGGEIVFIPLVPDHSTTETIRRIKEAEHINRTVPV